LLQSKTSKAPKSVKKASEDDVNNVLYTESKQTNKQTKRLETYSASNIAVAAVKCKASKSLRRSSSDVLSNFCLFV